MVSSYVRNQNVLRYIRYQYEDRGSRYRNIEYRMAADDPRFDPQVDLRTRLEQLRALIASANLINGRFGRKVGMILNSTVLVQLLSKGMELRRK